MPEGNRLNEKVSEEGDRSSEEKEEGKVPIPSPLSHPFFWNSHLSVALWLTYFSFPEDHLSRNKDEVGGGDSALADKGALGGDEGHKAGCEGDAATPGTVQSNGKGRPWNN